MEPQNPTVKYFVRIIYLILFCGITFFITVALTFLITLLHNHGYDLKEFGKIIPGVIGLLFFIYSFWLAKEASITFSENNSFFLEAVFISIKKSFMYLPFLPIVGKYFDKQQSDEFSQYTTKNIDKRTRFE